jgi:hypothetical protein
MVWVIKCLSSCELNAGPHGVSYQVCLFMWIKCRLKWCELSIVSLHVSEMQDHMVGVIKYVSSCELNAGSNGVSYQVSLFTSMKCRISWCELSSVSLHVNEMQDHMVWVINCLSSRQWNAGSHGVSYQVCLFTSMKYRLAQC